MTFKKLSKEQGIILSGFTGVMCVEDFGAYHADVELRLGRPVFTHQFIALEAEIKEAYRADFVALVKGHG